MSDPQNDPSPSGDPPRGRTENPTGELTHFDSDGRAHMVDVGAKEETHRVAVAAGRIRMRAETLEMVLAGTHRKGDVLGIARVAGIMAAKRTSELIPLCHPIGLTRVVVEFESEEEADLQASSAREVEHSSGDRHGEGVVRCRVRAETRSRTGVEMEALIGLQVALATIYDMCKAVDRGMVMTDIGLLEKRGGKSGDWRASGS